MGSRRMTISEHDQPAGSPSNPRQATSSPLTNGTEVVPEGLSPESLRIGVADDEVEMRDYFQRMLRRMGHEVVCVAENGRQLVDGCLAAEPDLVIADIRMPEMDGITAARAINEQTLVPVILVSAHHDPELVQQAAEGHIFAYLVKPIKKEDLQTAIQVAMARFRQFQVVQNEAQDLRRALSERKIIERAKGVLMKKAGLDESAAFRRLQNVASNKNQKLVEIAQMILTAEEAFTPGT